jgi:hypothetical protein
MLASARARRFAPVDTDFLFTDDRVPASVATAT